VHLPDVAEVVLVVGVIVLGEKGEGEKEKSKKGSHAKAEYKDQRAEGRVQS
jgi:hypothetical protein